MESLIDIDVLEASFEATGEVTALITLAVIVSAAMVELQTAIMRQREALRRLPSDSVLADVEGHMATMERLRRLHRALHHRIFENM